MSVTFISETLPLSFFADPLSETPTRSTGAGTLIGDLVIFGLVIKSDDSISVTPNQTGFDLVSHQRADRGGSAVHYMIYKALAVSNGSTAYDFTEAVSAFSTFVPDALNYLGCFVLRGQAVSWLADSQEAQREGAGDQTVLDVPSVGSFSDLTLTFQASSNPTEAAQAFSMDIAPATGTDHYNFLIGYRTVVGYSPAFTCTPDSGPAYAVIDNGSNGSNTGWFAYGLAEEAPPVSYNCTEEGCVDPGDGSGEFATLEECEAACIPVTYNCVDGVCVDPGDGSGEFATLEECEMSGCGAPTFTGTTERFDAGEGSQWYVIPQLSDSGDELRSKTVKAVRATGRLTNAAAMVYGYDVGQRIIMSDLENGERNPVKMVTRPQTFPDTTEVAQTARKPVNIVNAVLHTVRLSGDDTGQAARDRVDEIVYEVARQGVRR
jgi:hypothetical protein